MKFDSFKHTGQKGDEYGHLKKAPKICIVSDKVYLKAGVGMMKFDAFKHTGEKKDDYRYLKKTPKTCPLYNIAVGYRVSDAIRADLNLLHTKVIYKAKSYDQTIKQNIKTTAVFVNGYYDINLHDTIVPYLTAGLGIGINNAGELKPSALIKRKGKTKTNFVWNVGVGVQSYISRNFVLDIGYRYMFLGKTNTKGSESNLSEGGTQTIKGHQFICSVLYNFS